MFRCYFLSFFFGLLTVQKIGSLLKNITLVDVLLIVSTISFGRDVLTGYSYTAISRKVVGKSARDNPERCCGWFWVHCSSKKFERMAREAVDICLRVLKESIKTRFDSYSVKNRELFVSHITFRDCPVHIFSDNCLEVAVYSSWCFPLCGKWNFLEIKQTWIIWP